MFQPTSNSVDNSILISEISRLAKGADVTFANLSQWLNRPISDTSDLRNFGSVRRHLADDYGIVLRSIRGVGFHILTNEEAAIDNCRLHKIRRQARAIKREKATVDLSTLSQQQVQKVVGTITVASVIEAAAKEKTIDKIASETNVATSPLSLRAAMETFKKAF